MKNAVLMQLTVEVGRCTLPPLPYQEYSLAVRLTKELSASTTFKNAADGCVDFGTRLFLRTEKGLLESTPQCSVSVIAIGQKASRIEIARGEAKIGQEGPQLVRLGVVEGQSAFLETELEFCRSVWQVKQTKTNNNRLSNFKSHLSQKQSSCEQKQPQTVKPSPTASTPESIDKKDKANDHNNKFSALKPSRSEKVLPDKSVQLETSANTINHSAKTDQNLNKSADSDLLISMQIKIDQLEDRITFLQQQLRNCEEKIRAVTLQYEQEKGKAAQLEQKLKETGKAADAEREKGNELAHLYEQEKGRVVQLEQSKEHLSEMLILEEEKNNISAKYIEKLTKMMESLSITPPDGEFNPIEEKDEILMLNEELENELTNKNIAINQMKLEIEQLRQKVTLLQTAKTKKAPVYEAHPNEKLSLPPTKSAENQKPKIEKRASEKNIHTSRKSEEEPAPLKPKDVKKPKEKQSQKKEAKPEPTPPVKKPAVPKNPREVKSPPALKADITKTPKGKSKPLLKIEQKTTMQSQRKSQGESNLTSMISLQAMSEANHLMINSRSHDGEVSSS